MENNNTLHLSIFDENFLAAVKVWNLIKITFEIMNVLVVTSQLILHFRLVVTRIVDAGYQEGCPS